MTRYQVNHRPPPTDDVAYGVPALQLVDMVKAEAAFDAVAMAEAWKFEPPTSTPVPYAEIPREVAMARVGGWSRYLDAKQAAKRALKSKSAVPAEAAGELNAPPTYTDTPQEIASRDCRAKSIPHRLPQRNPWGKRRLTPGKVTA